MNISHETWLAFHDRMPEDLLGAEVAKLWKKDMEAGKTPKTPAFLPCSPQEYAGIQSTSTELFLAQWPINAAFEQVPLVEAGIALFNADGYLIHLKGSESFMAWAKEHGISRKTRWHGTDLSVNAVSAGLTLRKPIHFTGWKNFGSNLFDMSISFAPIIRTPRENPSRSEIIGGVGVIIPQASAAEQYLSLAVSLAQTVALTMWTTQFFMMTTGTMESTALTIFTAHGGHNIIQASRSSAKFFQSSHEELLYRELDTLISPPPKNESFWKLIEQGKTVKNQHMSISCTNGTTLSTYVSIEPLHIDALKVTGAQLVFKLFEDIAQEISPYLGKASTTLADIVGVSPAFCACLEKAKILSSSNSTILITGESGTGKDLFAQALHNAGPRRKRPFIAVNCAALPRDLISSELFGYEAGAFTGAKRNGSIGKFELANGGTLFLDEISEMDMGLQAKLLRAIQEGKIRPVGGVKEIDVDVRIICASNADLNDYIAEKKFRQDLYYRLSTFMIRIPPLRERRDDIPALADAILNELSRKIKRAIRIAPDALDALCHHDWPGNVRELRNVLEFSAYISETGVIARESLPEHFGRQATGESSLTLSERVKQFEREEIRKALEKNGRDLAGKKKTAGQLGISLATLYNKLAEQGSNSLE